MCLSWTTLSNHSGDSRRSPRQVIQEPARFRSFIRLFVCSFVRSLPPFGKIATFTLVCHPICSFLTRVLTREESQGLKVGDPTAAAGAKAFPPLSLLRYSDKFLKYELALEAGRAASMLLED